MKFIKSLYTSFVRKLAKDQISDAYMAGRVDGLNDYLTCQEDASKRKM